MLEWQLDGSGNWQSNVVTQNYGYDRFGNRGITSATGGVNSYNPSYTASTNRISSLTYDSAGNITYDAASGGTMTFDAENHMVTASSGGTYVYDGEGRRVKRTASSQEWWYVYGIGGELIAEYLSTGTTTVKKEYGYRSGQLLVLWDADKSGDERLKWLVTDHLGSTRMEADKSGSLAAMVRHDYLPFGEELAAGIRGSGYGYASTNVRQKFTGHERDGETGLDFAQARYCASIQGRFTSPDPLMASGRTEDPPSWNRYVYTLNNPLKYIDPLGLYEFDSNATDEQKERFRSSLGNLKKVRDSLNKNSKEHKRLDKIISAYGDEGKGGPTVKFGALGAGRGHTGAIFQDTGEGKKVSYSITVTFDSDSEISVGIIAHEGQHVSDNKDALEATRRVKGRYVTPTELNLTNFQREDRAYESQQIVAREMGLNIGYTDNNRSYELYRTSWDRIDSQSIPSVRAQMLLKRWEVLRESDEYRLTPGAQGSRITRPRP